MCVSYVYYQSSLETLNTITHQVKVEVKTMGISEGKLEYTRPIYDKSGKTAIPEPIRQVLGLEKGDDIRWTYTDGTLTVEKVEPEEEQYPAELTAD